MNEEHYKMLIETYYSTSLNYLLHKYNKSYREIYYILEEQEKKTLELQSILLEYEEQGKIEELVKAYGKPKASLKNFMRNVFRADTNKAIPSQFYVSIETMLNKLKNKEIKRKQGELFDE